MSSTSSSSGPGPGEGGAEPSPTAFVLRDNRSLVPSRRGPADAPAPPRPTEAASSRRHGACPLVPALSLGATGGARGEGWRDSSPWEPPQPRSPSSKRSFVGRMQRRGKDPRRGLARRPPLVPRLPPGRRDLGDWAEGGVPQSGWEAGPPRRASGGRAAAAGLGRGAQRAKAPSDAR